MARTLGQAAVLSQKEWKQLEQYASIAHVTIWAVLRLTAARVGETLKLRVKDVYLDPVKRIPLDAISFRKETRKGKDKNHCVPVCSELKSYLRNYQPPLDPEAYLFPGKLTGTHLTYEAAIVTLKRAANKAGLSYKKITTHSGRRSCITQLARKGTDLKTIQAISGHASLQNLSLYIDTDPETTKLALESIFN